MSTVPSTVCTAGRFDTSTVPLNSRSPRLDTATDPDTGWTAGRLPTTTVPETGCTAGTIGARLFYGKGLRATIRPAGGLAVA